MNILMESMMQYLYLKNNRDFYIMLSKLSKYTSSLKYAFKTTFLKINTKFMYKHLNIIKL